MSINTEIKVGVSCVTHCSDKINPMGHKSLSLFLESFFDSLKYDNFSVFIVDNSSDVKFNHKLLEDKRVTYIYIKDQIKHGGLTGAWNLGVRKCFDDGCDVILNSNDDVIFNFTINNMINTIHTVPFSDVGLFGPICNSEGVSTPHQKREEMCISEKIIETTMEGYALNGFFMGFSKHFFEKFNVNGNLFSTNPRDMWGGQEVELFKRNTPLDMRSFILENCYLHHSKYQSWLKARETLGKID